MDTDDGQVLEWQEFEVLGGYLSRHAGEQFTFSLQLAAPGNAWLTIHGVFDRTGANWGWRPSEPAFAPTITETGD